MRPISLFFLKFFLSRNFVIAVWKVTREKPDQEWGPSAKTLTVARGLFTGVSKEHGWASSCVLGNQSLVGHPGGSVGDQDAERNGVGRGLDNEFPRGWRAESETRLGPFELGFFQITWLCSAGVLRTKVD